MDVNVILRGFVHTFPDNVDTVLYGPGGSGTARILSDVGGNDPVNGIQLVIDDETAFQMPETSQLTGGRFKPTNDDSILDPMPAIFPNDNASLTVFNGDNPNGKWRFFVFDEITPDSGQFAGGWSVVIKAKVKR